MLWMARWAQVVQMVTAGREPVAGRMIQRRRRTSSYWLVFAASGAVARASAR